MFLGWRGSVLGIGVAGAALAFACGGNDHSFDGGTGATGGAAGDSDGSSTSGKAPMAGKTGGGTTSGGTTGTPEDGGAPATAGNAGEGEPMGAGGEGGASSTPTPECPDGYSTWLSSSFSFPDGDTIGTADAPSLPWAKTGSLKIDTGRLTGTGTAIVGQGAAFPYAGSRFRFRARFTDSNQQVTAAFDAVKDGTGGVRITVDSAGSLALTEGKIAVGKTMTAPLDTGIDWFVEAVIKGASAKITLSRTNYASETQSKLEATLSTDKLKVTAAGIKTVAELASAGGISPSIDEVTFARCGVEPPDYTPLFVDTFERADSTTLGNAEFPANSSWRPNSAKARIVSGALQVTALARASVPLKTVPGDGLRIRTTVSTPSDGLWADVNYNASADVADFSDPGFWVWGPQSNAIYTSVFLGKNGETPAAGKTFAKETDYFVELNRDDGVAVLTIRNGSFSGPLYVLKDDTGLTVAQNVGEFLWLGTDSRVQTTNFKDIRIDAYQPQ